MQNCWEVLWNKIKLKTKLKKKLKHYDLETQKEIIPIANNRRHECKYCPSQKKRRTLDKMVCKSMKVSKLGTSCRST